MPSFRSVFCDFEVEKVIDGIATTSCRSTVGAKVKDTSFGVNLEAS